MKVIRSTKCSLKFTTKKKLAILEEILEEYNKVVNFYIDRFWPHVLPKKEIVKKNVDLPDTWLSFMLRQSALRLSTEIVKASKDEEKKPAYRQKMMHLFSKNVKLKDSNTQKFDCWIHLWDLGRKIKLNLPTKLHKHFHKLNQRGKRLNSYKITKESIQFAFEIETGLKRLTGECIGIDTGIRTLATISKGKHYGKDIKELIETIIRCKRGSKRQKRLRSALRQRMDEIAKEIAEKEPRLIVVEKLKKINKNSKKTKRISKYLRKVLGSWNYRYWLDRLQRACEDNCVTFRSVYPEFTSQRCSVCGHTEKGNRHNEMFKCQKCGYTDDADVNAAKNILDRFLSGPYGAGFKPESEDLVA